MPHCIIEYANDLTDLITANEMMDAAFKAMQASTLFETDHIKIRTHEYAYFQRADERKNFIHVTVKMLSGRTLEQKQQLASLVSKAIDELPVFGITVTVDIVDMDKECYVSLKN